MCLLTSAPQLNCAASSPPEFRHERSRAADERRVTATLSFYFFLRSCHMPKSFTQFFFHVHPEYLHDDPVRVLRSADAASNCFGPRLMQRPYAVATAAKGEHAVRGSDHPDLAEPAQSVDLSRSSSTSMRLTGCVSSFVPAEFVN